MWLTKSTPPWPSPGRCARGGDGAAAGRIMTLSPKLTIPHIFLAPSEGQVRRTGRGRFDRTDNVWTVRRTRVDENNSRGQCASHGSMSHAHG